MNCRRAQTDIALWAGDDLDESDCQGLRRHLEACPDCREYRAQMQALMQLVEDCPLKDEAVAATKSGGSDSSLWPSLSTRLVSLPSGSRADRFNGWIPAVAVAAVCLAMLIVASPQMTFGPSSAPVHSDFADSSGLPTTPIQPSPAFNVLVDDHPDGSEFPIMAPPRRTPALPPGLPPELERLLREGFFHR